jgi:hypothetical protein
MTEIPFWWLAVSGTLFLIQIVFIGCLIFAVLKLTKAIQQVVPKVDAIANKVQNIGDKVEDLTTSVKSTMSSVGDRAKSVAGSADLIAHTAANTFQKFSPVIVGVLSGLKILKAVMELRADRKAHASKQTINAATPAPKQLAKVDKKA